MAEASFRLKISRPGKPDHWADLPPGVYPVGADKKNLIVLPAGDVSWKHAILSVQRDQILVEDLATDNGTFVDGQRVDNRQAVIPGQTIRIGPYSLALYAPGQAVPDAPKKAAHQAAAQAATPRAAPRAAAQAAPAAPAERKPEPALAPGDPGATLHVLAKTREEENRDRIIRKQIHDELLKRLDIRRMAAGQINEKELREKAQVTIRQIISDVEKRLPPGIDPERLAKEVYDEAIGLGPLEDLLSNTIVTEIMVNGPERVYVEVGGKLRLTNCTFLNEESVLSVIERIVAPIGRRIDESQPYVDARLPDGSRVNAIIHPLSLSGPCLTIRKFSKDPFTVQDLVRFRTWTPEISDFIRACVLLRKNIIISGGTGSGKTTLLNVCSNFLPVDERIVTIEDAAELRLNQPHVIRLEARPPNIEGKGAIGVRDLVRNALRMRPDRIVVGECRGGEALDMLQAMNTGHEGSLTTVHANSPRDVISRLETMVLMSGMDLPVRAIREQIGAAIHMIVHESRFSDGSRKVSRITEVVGMEGDQIVMQDIFEFKQTGLSEKGEVLGSIMPTGSVPTFVEDMRVRGITIDQSIFDPGRYGR